MKGMIKMYVIGGISLFFSGSVLANETSTQEPILLENFSERIKKLVNSPTGDTYIITRSGYANLNNPAEVTLFATAEMISAPVFSGVNAFGEFFLLSAKNINEHNSHVELWLHDPIKKTTRKIYSHSKPQAFNNVELTYSPNDYDIAAILEDVPTGVVDKQSTDVTFVSSSSYIEPVQLNKVDFLVRNVFFERNSPYSVIIQGERFGRNHQESNIALRSYDITLPFSFHKKEAITSMPQDTVSHVDNLICGFKISTPLFSCGQLYNDSNKRWTRELAGVGLIQYATIVKGQGMHTPVVYAGNSTTLYSMNADTGQLLSEINIPAEKHMMYNIVSAPSGQHVYRMFTDNNKNVGAFRFKLDASIPETLFTLPVPKGEVGITSPLIKDNALYFGVGRGLYRHELPVVEDESSAPVAIAGKDFTVKRNVENRGYDLNGLASQNAEQYRWSIVEGANEFWLQVEDGGEWKSYVEQPTARALIPGGKTGQVTYRLEVKNKQGEMHYSDITVTVE